AEVESLAVIARDANRFQRARPQRRQVAHNRSGTTRRRSDASDLVRRSARLKAAFLDHRVTAEVLIEEKISHNGDSHARKSLDDFCQALLGYLRSVHYVFSN